MKRRLISPTTILVVSFAVTILTGTVVLLLPVMTHQGSISFIDALFTSTSAVCVTGLIVVDTGSYFTLPGQWVVLALIQTGALGILTFSSFFVLLLRGDTSLRGRMLIQEAMTHFPYQNLIHLLRNILLFTLGTELIGAFCLWLAFKERYAGARALYLSLFHAVSAFCNAGFSLWPNNLEDYSTNFPVCSTIMALIIFGGLGFIVITEVADNLFRRKKEFRRLSLHSRVVLTATASLIIGGAALFWLFELSDSSFIRRPFLEQILASFFQSVAARTAGFNTVPIGGLTNATLLLLIILMFIGASPGSVGGGIKTTTFSIAVVMVVAYLKGKEHPEVFGRTIPARITSKAMATFASAFTLVIVSTLLLQVLESYRLAEHSYFIDFAFEAVSAFGTVGLSTGVTSGLSGGSKLVIIATMFFGRVGPLGLALALLGGETEQRYKYPEENVMIG